eukprot:TRINITY_DN2224_c0_g2_i1.p1 TRINITY_DN2224_c0_g2~~TRINITY_DN2224_c0_g2_i1.p1  ORF type:complete len:112 (-),score=19.19 TRINITY_DN2224_c0_g2_i1:171-506(-)
MMIKHKTKLILAISSIIAGLEMMLYPTIFDFLVNDYAQLATKDEVHVLLYRLIGIYKFGFGAATYCLDDPVAVAINFGLSVVTCFVLPTVVEFLVIFGASIWLLRHFYLNK